MGDPRPLLLPLRDSHGAGRHGARRLPMSPPSVVAARHYYSVLPRYHRVVLGVVVVVVVVVATCISKQNQSIESVFQSVFRSMHRVACAGVAAAA
ncbi:hypothetical protein E2C01_090589 [Portunus trituberculatus]|uniref:Opacity-associated protein A-like N-terminal domain-containing protein n=1 Tax=Portunus trituberculatus TaxID=210409 RepID=A0A5B7JBS1_PORTR|nr:hypothetical protein [Portunus trituberculatus]